MVTWKIADVKAFHKNSINLAIRGHNDKIYADVL